jgi:hypothetical protein
MRRSRIWVLFLLFVSGCSRREGMNFDCVWPFEASRPLDVRNPSHIQHVLDDIRIAEELEIRYGDRLAGRRMSSVFGIVVRTGGQGPSSTSRLARSESARALFKSIAERHDISVPDVLNVRQSLPARGANLPVTAPMLLFYIFLAWRGLRWVTTRTDPAEMVHKVPAVLYASLVITGAVILLGGLWTGAVEIVRLGNEHLSYRASRLSWPWTHSVELFLTGVVVFWIIVAVQQRLTRRSEPPRG